MVIVVDVNQIGGVDTLLVIVARDPADAQGRMQTENRIFRTNVDM